jgi:hypothetical protein
MLLARNRRRRQKIKAEEWRAAKKVQRSWRGKKGRDLFGDSASVIDKFGELAEITETLKLKNEAAIKIQNCWRSHDAWMKGPVALDRAMQVRRLQNMAATTIQSRRRGQVGRRKAALWKIHVGKQTHLGIHCQRLVRGFLARIFFYYERKRIRMVRANAATKLQALWQGRIGRAKVRETGV